MSIWKGIIQAKEEFKTISAQYNRKELTSDLAIESARILKKDIKTEDDLFLHCAALNYINAYNKSFPTLTINILQDEFKNTLVRNGCDFIKKRIDQILLCIIKNDLTFSSFDIHSKGEVLIDVAGVQFVFYNVRISKPTKELIKKEIAKREKGLASKFLPEKFDGLRLQPIATDVLIYAENLANLTVFHDGRLPVEKE